MNINLNNVEILSESVCAQLVIELHTTVLFTVLIQD